MQRKIFKAGNSLVVSLPKEAMQLLGLSEGSEIELTMDVDQQRLIIEQATIKTSEINEEFAAQIDDFIEKYRPALEALAK